MEVSDLSPSEAIAGSWSGVMGYFFNGQGNVHDGISHLLTSASDKVEISKKSLSCGCFDRDGYSLISSFGDLSPCVVDGLFINSLALFTIISGYICIARLRRQKNESTKTDGIFAVKLGLIILQIVFQIYIIKHSTNYNYPDGYSFLDDSVWWSKISSLIALFVVLTLTYIERFKSFIAQTPLLLFWTGNIVFGILRMSNSFLRSNSAGLSYAITAFTINSLLIILIELNFPPKLVLDPTEKINIYDYSNLFSKLSFTWMTPLMQTGYQKFLIQKDLPPLPTNLKTEYLSNILTTNWNYQIHKSKTNPSLFWAIANSFGGPFILAGFFKMIQDCIAFIQPQLLKQLILFVNEYDQDHSIPLTRGFMIVGAMFLLSILQTASLHQYFERVFDTGIKVKSSLTSLIYEKSLNLSVEAKQQKSTGDIVNLMSVDTQRLQDLCQNLQLIWSGPFQMILCLISLYNLLGNAMWIGVFVLGVTVPLNTAIFRYQKSLQKTQMKVKDERTGLISEILNNIKSLKLYAWENPYKGKLDYVRNEKELKNLKKIGIFQACNQFIFNSTPYVVSCSTFALFIIAYKGTPLSTDIVFTALSLFNLLGFPLMALPWTIGNIIESQVALGRLSDFLAADELEDELVNHLPAAKNNGEIAVQISQANFLWSREPYKTALVDINFDAKKGDLNCILGSVGAGKSAILQALLGDLHKPEGIVTIKGSIAYVPQTAWIMNGTIKENILFGCKFNQEFYDKTIIACALEPDFEILPDGDSTQVGEKGISLSGGQKARLSLARAVYARADVYLLDDILSAVDEHVGKHLINNVIGPAGLLKNKCRILATNSMTVLKFSDNITLLENGRITEAGTYDNIMNNSVGKGHLNELIKEFGRNKKSDSTLKADSAAMSASQSVGSFCEELSKVPADDLEKAELEDYIAEIETKEKTQEEAGRDEKHEQGKVDWSVYLTYANACGLRNVLILIGFIVFAMGMSVLGNVWLKHWSEINTREGFNPEPWKYLGIYFLLCFSAALATMFQSLIQWLLCSISGSKYLHSIMLSAVLRAPMQFFETTPIGRILNRFSNDIYKVDEQLFRVFGMFFGSSIRVAFSILVIIYSTWQFIFLVGPLFVIYKYYQKYYLYTSRELRRLDSVSRSPIFAHFQETLSGVSTIRAYSQTDRFQFLNKYKMDSNMSAYHPSVSANRWLAVRLEFLGSLVILGSSGLLILTLRSGHVTPGLVGLSVSYSLQITQALNWIVRMTVDIESNIVSVERIMEYAALEPEAPEIVEGHRPNTKWPFNGSIEFKDYSTRYREGLDLVLKDINLSIKQKEKIGIVGRTGAGKSSLTLAMFRIIEPAGGHIEIDDVNTSDIGLYDLRSKLSIIPQDSQIFQGTIRANLDPTEQYNDQDLWDALELSHLKSHVLAMFEDVDDKEAIQNNPLLVPLSEGGSNLSAGQRQLMCLARALTKKDSKVLVLDEATANVDVHTDKIVQETIRSAFKDRTILTIAHRLNTIIDSDKIIVLEQGRVKEFDTPQELLKKKDGLFYSLCLEGGLVHEDE
ncbi:ATP-binding cassette glutathione S-conjugate transporter [Martiniozyma asiatica (nom. inval.)]|nr:ATP-binding cassette glutathione S-conjugate transporter [Martiniozyma asiatica]